MRHSTTLRLLLGLSSALASGCALDLAALRAEDASVADEDARVAPADDASTWMDAISPTPDAGTRDTGSSPTTDAGAVDSSRRLDSGPPPAPTCGVLGTPCCDPDQRCDLGACLRGTCVAYGGAFGTLASCSPGCRSRNIYTAGCSCPRGFAPSPVMEMRASCDGAATSASLSICTSTDRTAPTDYAGAWLEIFGCGGGCTQPNSYTGGCSCPFGTESVAMDVEVETSCGTTPATFALCVTASASMGSFGGGYQLGAAGAPGCTGPNPRTGACSCPAGTTSQTMPVINDVPGGFTSAPIFLCSR